MESIDLLIAFSTQLFIIVDPVGVIPVFLTITTGESSEERRRMALRGCLMAFVVSLSFLLFGQGVLSYFGIENAAVQTCGGVLLFVIALEMLYGRPTRTGTSPKEEQVAEGKDDISVVPLGFPLLAGPGAITTCVLFSDGTVSWISDMVLVGGLAIVFLLTYLFLAQSERFDRFLGVLGVRLATRVMGLLLAFLATEYIISGVRSAFVMSLR